MPPFFRLLPLLCLAIPAMGQTYVPSVGSGSPNAGIQSRFVNAFYRGLFSNAVTVTPIADVKRLGTTGLVQEFYDLKKTGGVKYALVLADQSKYGFDGDVVQVLPDIYSYYTTIGSTLAGYPTIDTQSCPGVSNCTYELFSLNYALFSYTAGNVNGSNFAISGNLYLKWAALGGVSGSLGLVTDASRTVTSPTKVTATTQDYTGGSIFSVTSGIYSGSTFAVVGTISALYQQIGGITSSLGLPIGDESLLASGVNSQSFEGGRIQYPTGGAAVLLLPVKEIQLTPNGALTIPFGQTLTVTEHSYDANGNETSGRSLSWITSNSHVVTITVSGNTAILKAVGGGIANVSLTSEGVLSPVLVVTVTAPCCAIGEGAPTSAVQQAFQDAVTRNNLSIQVPGPNAVQRVSSGYTQDLVAADGTRVLVTKSDASATAYTVTGALLTAYRAMGATSGALGFPAQDATAGGRQLFERGAALAGSPIQVVAGAVLTKWAVLGYESGVAGAPVAVSQVFTSQSVYTGNSQAFAGGVIYAFTTGNRAGQGYFVSGLILARYLALGGPGGSLGIPVSDTFGINNTTRQNFENGYVDFAPGAAVAVEHLLPRTPAISANPTTALAGSVLHLAVTGFANGANLRVSVTGQPDFQVTTSNGTYEWDIFVPSSAKSATILVHAAAVGSNAIADGSYSVKSLTDARPKIAKLQGDNQTGAPGSHLSAPLTVLVTDSAGAPIANASVTFTASPGSQTVPASTVTNALGQASTSLRLPSVSGIAAVTAKSLGQIAIFDAQATGSVSLASFPSFNQGSFSVPLGNGADTVARKGSLLTASAAILRFYQNQGLLAAPNGLADPATLNQFLTKVCLSGSSQNCDGFVSTGGDRVVNLWRLAGFVGGVLDISVESPDVASVRDLVSAGDPVLLSLGLTQNGTPAGGAYVVATGVTPDGGLQIFDPNPGFAQASLDGYLSGFTAGGFSWKGSLLSAARLLPRAPSPVAFLVSAISQPASALPVFTGQSAGGKCSGPFSAQDAAVATDIAVSTVLISSFLYCDGQQATYQVGISAKQAFVAGITDLSPGGGQFDISRPGSATVQVNWVAGQLTVSAPSVQFTTASVVNAATFTAGISPGGIISIFGTGLADSSGKTTVMLGSTALQLLLTSPFQINAVVPAGAPAGAVQLTVTSPFGSSIQPVTVQAAAPGIFVLGRNSDGSSAGAVVNQDGSINSAANPGARGGVLVIYGTGLGTVSRSGSLMVTDGRVTVVVGGTELPVAFAGLTPGFVGLYQVNVSIPAATPPGLSIPLQLKEGGILSNPVSVALQ